MTRGLSKSRRDDPGVYLQKVLWVLSAQPSDRVVGISTSMETRRGPDFDVVYAGLKNRAQKSCRPGYFVD